MLISKAPRSGVPTYSLGARGHLACVVVAAVALSGCLASVAGASEAGFPGAEVVGGPSGVNLAQAEETAPKGLPAAPSYVPGTIITPDEPPAVEPRPKRQTTDKKASSQRTATKKDRGRGEAAVAVEVEPPLPADTTQTVAPTAAAVGEMPKAPVPAVARPPANPEVWDKLRPYVPEPGNFAVVPGSALAPVLVKDGEFDFCGDIKCYRSSAVLGAWNGGAFDSQRGEFRVHGGGHADYGGNEVYAFEFSTLHWTRETDPQPLTGPFMKDTDGDQEEDACPMPAAGPPATHTYQGFVYVPKIERYWLFGTVGYCSNGMGTSSAWEYDAADKSWTAMPEFDRFARYARLVIDPSSGNVIVHVGRNTGWHEIDPASRKVVRSFKRDAFGSYLDGPAVFDPQRSKLFAMVNARKTDRLIAYDWPSTPEGKLKSRLIAEWPQAARKYWGLGLHASGVLVLWDGNDRILVVDPESGKSWETAPGGDDYGSMGDSDKAGKVYSKWDYIPQLDAFFGITNPDLGIVLYRLGGQVKDAIAAPEAAQRAERLVGENASESGAASKTEIVSKDDKAESPKRLPQAPAVVATAAGVAPPSDNGRKIPLEIEEAASWEEVCAAAVLCDPMGDGDVLYRGKVVESGPPKRGRHWRSVGHKMGHPDSRLATADPDIGGLRFYFPSNSPSGAAGNFKTNFSPDYSFQVGPAETGAPVQEVFIQFQVRYSCTFIWTDCDPASSNYRKERRCFRNRSSKDGCTASKIALIATGDREGDRADACTLIQTALNHGSDHYLHGFHRCPRARGFGERLPRVGGRYQGNSQPNGLHYCPRILDDYSVSGWNNTADSCFRLIDDKWITLQIHLRFGPWQKKPKKRDPRLSHVSIWGAIEGEHGGRQRLVIDNDFYAMEPRTPHELVGKIWLMPHLYGKTRQEDHPPFNVWYRNLVISETRIPNPG